MSSETEIRPTTDKSGLALLSLSALGVVFGDIGTSPLYTFKTVLALQGGNTSAEAIFGALSLIIWTLIIVTTIKYVGVAMRVDNDGEGGIMALLSLLGQKIKTRPAIVAIGLLGAALIYGDGAVTPAISVLSALEGLTIVTPIFQPYVLPLGVAILLLLFAVQFKGTSRIGEAFGPIMVVWFMAIGVLGLWGIIQYPAVLWAINPYYGLHYLFMHGLSGFLILGGVFLCVTGAEALYADMGNFGAKPIRLAWQYLVFPCLVLNYAGQAALVLQGAPTTDNIFYRLCPSFLLAPFVALATVATIIASQAIITGAFSMTRQAVLLGWLPHMRILQTSENYGQIYVGVVNWLLMIVTVGLAIGFGKSDNLASAYGIAVSATMLATSVLLFIAMREIWEWSLLKAGLVAGCFVIVDGAFFLANLSKFASGGYVPLILAFLVYAAMTAWHRGTIAVMEQIKSSAVPIDDFMAKISKDKIARVSGTAIFLTRTKEGTPPVMQWHALQNKCLHQQVFILKITTKSVPWIDDEDRLTVSQIAPDIWRGAVAYGFMEHPDIPEIVERMDKYDGMPNLGEVTYYVGHETIIRREDGKGLPGWIAVLFAFMQRNSLHLPEYFKLPADSVVEIGREFSV